jgi:hypothetical protein
MWSWPESKYIESPVRDALGGEALNQILCAAATLFVVAIVISIVSATVNVARIDPRPIDALLL